MDDSKIAGAGAHEARLTVDRLLTNSALRWPAKEAVHHAGHSASYREIDASSWRMARLLQSKGIVRGDRIALILPNSLEFVVCFFAISRAQAVVVPLNPAYTDEELRDILADAGTRIVLCRNNVAERVAAMRLDIPGFNGALAIESRSALADILAGHSSDPVTGNLDWRAAHSILYTSGTTGRPKGAILSHRSRLINSLSIRVGHEITAATRTSCPAPMFHSGGMMLGLVSAVAAGATLLIPSDPSVEAACGMLADHGANLLLCVPTQIYRMVESDQFRAAARRHSFAIIHGASPIPQPVVEQLLDELPTCRPYHGYGSTEASQLTVLDPEEYRARPEATGRALPAIRVDVVDDEQRPVPPGTVGEIVTSGPHVFDGYLNAPEQTAAALRDGCHWTGDLAVMDETGLMTIVGRTKDVVISGGFNVYAQEVENVLHTHPAIQHAAVFGVPDLEWGEAVAAAIILRPGMNLSAVEVIDLCRAKLASYKKPRHVWFVDEMPRTPVGKVQKKELARRLTGRAA